MPYSIEKKGDVWCVYNNDTGKKMGEHDSRTEAMKQMKALYAEEGKPAEKKKPASDDEGDHEYRE